MSRYVIRIYIRTVLYSTVPLPLKIRVSEFVDAVLSPADGEADETPCYDSLTHYCLTARLVLISSNNNAVVADSTQHTKCAAWLGERWV